MKFVNLMFSLTKEKVLELLADNELVNRNVKFDDRLGKPQMTVKEKNGRVKITCQMIGGATRDNGFLIGTVFYGKIKENGDKTTLSGVITTAPIYHLALLVFVGIFIYQCIKNVGFSVIPIVAVGMSILMFKDEFKKQGYISRYLLRAQRRVSSEKN